MLESGTRGANASAIAAAIDLDPTLHAPTRKKGHVWHAARVCHRCRCLMPLETGCEAWGSMLHILFNDQSALNPRRMAARLFLKEAGVVVAGSRRDEELVEDIVVALVDTYHKQPHVRRLPATSMSFALRQRKRAHSELWRPHVALSSGDALAALKHRVLKSCTIPMNRKHPWPTSYGRRCFVAMTDRHCVTLMEGSSCANWIMRSGKLAAARKDTRLRRRGRR